MNKLTDGFYKWIAVIAAVYAMTCPAAAAQSGDVSMKGRLQQVAESHTVNHEFMGTVLVTKGDDVLLNKGYGIADMDWRIPNAPDVKFRIGSLTKQFTATLILLLQEDGKLRIGDSVSKYLPKTPDSWKDITLANLLGHTSGIPNFTSDKRFPEWSMSPRTHEEIIAFFRDEPLGFAPGSKFEYSNSNYEVLGMVIEKVSGGSYRDMLRERILKLLHLENTGLDSDERIVERHARGYRHGEDGLVRARSETMTVPWAAGSMYSTTGDLLRWERGLFGGKILSDASLKAMTTPGKGDYGLGLDIATRYGVKVVSHGGGIEGFNAYLGYVPEHARESGWRTR